ncbi:hypothetical protein MKW92_045296 [Papaver armeniacum]|nr:hypothetical protein MKW92_045296 [Papaver armeniacum]
MGVNTNGDIGNVVSADVKSNEDRVLAASVATNGKLAVRADVAKVMPLMDAVVKVFCVHSVPNFSLPWQRERQYSSTSSGFIISGRKVLTNAHSVEHYTQVKLKKRGSDVKYLAKVLAIGNECDIGISRISLPQYDIWFNFDMPAMLTVEDDEFWDGVSPVQFGSLPALQDAVTVVGYPIGGDTISVTSGVVSRMEIFPYEHGSTELLGLQIDAAINFGNSGGPAFNDKGKCVAIAFQTIKREDVENMGYVIPTTVVMHFIEDYDKKEEYTAMGMTSQQKGVRITRFEPTSPEYHFDGIDIANDGTGKSIMFTFLFTHGERIAFSYLISQKYTGENAIIEVLRDSKILEFNIKLATRKRLIPANIKGNPPSYYIVAGFVFTVVSIPFLHSEYGKENEQQNIAVKLLDKHLFGMAQSEDEQLVVISQVLVADINIGYEDIVNTEVFVKNLKGLASMVENCVDEYLKFELDYQHIVVLETKAAKAATPDILSTHCIPSAMSADINT